MANHRMNPSISVITLGVNDLGKALAFYRDGLGLQTNGISGTLNCCRSKKGPTARVFLS